VDVLIIRILTCVLFILSGCYHSRITAQVTDQLGASVQPTVKAERLSVTAAKSACRIFIGADSGTCFFVTRARNNRQQTVLVTAAHLFEKAKGKEAKLVFRESAGRREITIPIQNSANMPLWKKHSKYDIAGLAVDLPDSDLVNIFPMEQLADQELFDSQTITVGQACQIPSFPAKLESTSLGYPILRSGSIASYPLTPVLSQPTFMIDISAFGGDSGAPVLSAVNDQKESIQSKTDAVDQPEAKPKPKLMVVGLVFAKQRQTHTTVTPYEELVRHTPMGISIAVNSVFIRQTIEMMP